MRKTPPRPKMEPMAPKVQSRYLSAPSVSCHDHCKGGTKLESSNSVNRIKKTPSLVPKITTRNVKNNSVVKDPSLKKDGFTLSTKKGVAIEPKSRDLKPKSENSQAKKPNPPNSRISGRRHSDMFLPNEDTLPPSSRVPKRRLSEIGIRPKKDVSVSNTSLVRGSRISKIETRKDSKVSTVSKKPNSIKPTVSSPKRGAKVPPLRSYKSLPQSDLKTQRKSKPKKPIEEVEKTLHVVEPNNEVETTNTESHIAPDSSPIFDEKGMTNGDNMKHECSSPKEDDTVATDSQHDDNIEDSEAIDTTETTHCSVKIESHITPDSSPISDEKTMKNGDNTLHECSSPKEEDTVARDSQQDDNIADSEAIDTTETTDCSTKTESHITPDSSPSSEENNMMNDHVGLQECSPLVEDDTSVADGEHNENVADSEVIDTKEMGKLVVETTDSSLDDIPFRRGKFLSPHSEGSSPRSMQFREGKELDEKETEKVEKVILRRMSFDGVMHVPESQSVNVDLKHQEVAEKEIPSLYNKVIEETASKLIQTRKSKVKALVGAFEKVVSGDNHTP